jgi:DNA polymerase-3 subunit epsilon
VAQACKNLMPLLLKALPSQLIIKIQPFTRFMPNTFTAIDFETAQGKRWSICQVGLVRIENGLITDKISKLVCPPDNFYHYRNTGIHGIGAADTCGAPTFDALWPELKPYIHNQTVVAHNGAFDFSCLNQTLAYYGVEPPAFIQKCTYKLFRKKLDELCREHRIPLNHHDALSDALACAQLYLLALKN